MPSAVVILAMASALGCGLVAGALFAFSTFVMRALGRLPAPQAVAAMQQINITAINPWFMTAIFGTAATCSAAIVATLPSWDGSYGPYLVAGGAIYLIGTVGLTISYHVPRNDALAKIAPAGGDAAGHWDRYLSDWTRWNHVRTAAALIASGLEVAALYVG